MQGYTEKEALTDALTAQKGATTLYNTFANECVHDDLRASLMKLLNEEHGMQNDVFNVMHGKGYYPTPDAESKKVKDAKDKFKACC